MANGPKIERHKAGDAAPIVFDIAVATASGNSNKYVAFSLDTSSGPISFAMTMEQLGHFIGLGVRVAERHAVEFRRPGVPAGTVMAVEIVPEALTVSHFDIDGVPGTSLVAVIGDLSLAFKVDRGMFLNVVNSIERGPILGPNPSRTSRTRFPTSRSNTIVLPSHGIAKFPFSASLLPSTWAGHVGLIVVLWGDFEYNFDHLLKMLIAHNQSTATDLEMSKFRYRATLMRDEARIAFSQYPNILAYVEAIVSDALDIYAIRNLIAHGRMLGEVLETGYRLTIEGLYKKKPVSTTVGSAEIETLYMDISHLCGIINYVLGPHDLLKSQPFSFEDKSFLRTL